MDESTQRQVMNNRAQSTKNPQKIDKNVRRARKPHKMDKNIQSTSNKRKAMHDQLMPTMNLRSLIADKAIVDQLRQKTSPQ